MSPPAKAMIGKALPRERQIARVTLGLLLALGAVYLVTVEPAPGVRVRWRDGVTAETRGRLEQKYLLVNGGSPNPDDPRSLAYDLLDTSASNIEALVKDPAVADTNDIERTTFRVEETASPGETPTWVANRLPGLRHAPVRWSLLSLLLLALAVSTARIAAERRWMQRSLAAARGGMQRTHVAYRRDIRSRWISAMAWLSEPDDLFDRLPMAAAGPRTARRTARQFIGKVALAAMLVLIAGVPVLATWSALLLGGACGVLLFAEVREGWRPLAAAAVIASCAIGIGTLLPRADIAEAHNAFLVLRSGEPLERGLPHDVFQSWKRQFETVYPPAPEPYPHYSWRQRETTPEALYTDSSDALWRRAKYTRQVDAIAFASLAEFRGGFANDIRFNFWGGGLERPVMPFYAMYELTPASAGSALAWTGELFWQRADGAFDRIVHERPAQRTITPEDAGRRVYALFIPERDGTFDFQLLPSLRLRLASIARALIALAAMVLILVVTARPRWPALARAATLFVAGCILVQVFTAIVGMGYIGRPYAPHFGGDDGLAHENYARGMTRLVREGRILDGLEGGEPVYWFTPGTRYFRMVEKLVFGDTNHLYALLLACTPIAVFFLMRQLLPVRWAWLVTLAFSVAPVGNFAFHQYVWNARLGYGEALGIALFFLGLALLLRTQPPWGGRDELLPVAIGGAALAASMFVRPNFAIAVVWLGVAHAWASWRRGAWGAISALAVGLAAALWMPFHNWYYGGEFYLISKSGATMSVPLGPRDYAAALADLARGQYESEAVITTFNQVRGWLLGRGFVLRGQLDPLARVADMVKLFAFGLTLWTVVRWALDSARARASGRRGAAPALGVIAVAAVCAHIPMLFVFETHYRYAMLGWDLSLVVMLAWVARLCQTLPAQPAETSVV